MNPQEQASQLVGKVALFIGNECRDWQPAQFGAAARSARSLGVDTIVPKRSNGTEKWYGDPGRLKAEYAATTAAGCGYLPMSYNYGPRFGLDFVNAECDVLLEMTNAIGEARGGEGFACADLEAEWDGQVAAAERFTTCMQGKPGFLFLTTWADPDQQNWDAVTRALLPVVNMWIPQQYNGWLAAQEWELNRLGEPNIAPAIDLTQEFGNNDQLAIANQAKQRGHSTIWLWEYLPALANRQLTQAVASVMHR